MLSEIIIIAVTLTAFCFSVESNGQQPTSYLYENDNDDISCIKCQGFSFDFMGSYNRRVYDKINEHLIKLLPDDEDADTNLNEAISWLATSNIYIPFNPYRVALKQLVGLLELKENTKCDLDEFKLLENVNKATKFNAKKPERSQGSSARRIDKVVNKYFVYHAKGCQANYMKKFNTKYGIVTNSQIQRAEIFVNGILYGKLKSIEDETLSNWIKCQKDELKKSLENFDLMKIRYILNVRWIYSAANLYDALLHLAKDDPDIEYLKSAYAGSKLSESLEHSKRVEALFDWYIIEPCKYYIEQLGTDILAPATYESDILADEEWKNKKRIMNNFSYYLARSNFLYCTQTIEREAELKKELVTVPKHRIESNKIN